MNPRQGWRLRWEMKILVRCVRGRPCWPLNALAVLACLGLLLGPRNAAAQGSHAFGSLGAGATDISGGVTIAVPRTPIAVGGEFGVGNLFWSSLTALYQPLGSDNLQTVQPFMHFSVTSVGSSPYHASGVSAGGGVMLWLWPRVGIRTEAIKFWPTFNEDRPVRDPFEPRLWAARVGLAVRW